MKRHSCPSCRFTRNDKVRLVSSKTRTETNPGVSCLAINVILLFHSSSSPMDHSCCTGRGCGECANCTGECEECAPRYGTVDWPPTKEEQAFRRPVCDCTGSVARPIEYMGSRSICARCECYLYPPCLHWRSVRNGTLPSRGWRPTCPRCLRYVYE
jgi:hypothetical protein